MKVPVALFAGLTIVATASSCSALTTGAKTPAVAATPLIGTWYRTNSCTALVRELTRTRLKSQIRDTLVGAGYFQSPSQIRTAAPCNGARNLKHSHFFAAQGAFGSYDQAGHQVDNGDYKILAANTLAFPSHVRDFGYKIKVHYAIKRGRLRFAVVVPHPCMGKCPGATAWAISAFYSGPAFTWSK